MNKFEYNDKINCEFSEACYLEMAHIRFELDFCCEKDLRKWNIKKQILDLNNINHELDKSGLINDNDFEIIIDDNQGNETEEDDQEMGQTITVPKGFSG